MQENAGRSASRTRWVGVAVALVSLALSLYAIWLLSWDARREIDRLATASGDSLQWSLSQAELEHAKLMIAALAADPDDRTSLRELRNRFDVFYSRVGILERSDALGNLRAQTRGTHAVDGSRAFLDKYVSAIDGTDAELAASLSAMREDLPAIEDDLRRLSLAGVSVFAQQSQDQRERVTRALFDLAVLIFLLGVVLIGLITVLAQLLAFTRRQASELELAQDRLRSIVSTSLDGVVVVSKDGRILDLNAAAEKIFGYVRDDVLDRQMGEMIIPPHLREAHEAGMRRFLATGETKVIGAGLLQMEAMRSDGSVFPVELSISTAQSDQGLIFISFIQDISARVAAEAELVEARDRAVLGEKAKADLLAVMSHEMRTPLNGILGTLELLQTTDLDERQRHFAETMGMSGRMLLRHVNDVLEVSRMDAEAVELTAKPFDPSVLVHSVGKSLQNQIEARGNVLAVRLLGPVPRQVMGDRGRIEQVLVNLVGNASKFTENGRITIEVEAMPGCEIIELRVIDTGIGIAEAELDRIFEDFVTLDTSYSRSHQGTGLGLGIARRIVGALGGEIGVESEIGDGSVFWVRLPLPALRETPAAGTGEMPVPPASAVAQRVLLVEDNEVNRMVAREMLREHSCEVVEAEDGQEGVELAASAAFDMILMDINMPRLDGMSAFERISAGDGPNRATPVVALTANALPEDIRRYQEAGFRDVIVKPLSRNRIASVLARRFDEPHFASEPVDELEDVLGRERAARQREQAVEDISAALDRLSVRCPEEGPVEDILRDIHRMSGFAAIVGLREVHAHLQEMESRLRLLGMCDLSDDIDTVRTMLAPRVDDQIA